MLLEKETLMNWYVLFVLSNRAEHLVSVLNKREKVKAFIPQYEYYRRSSKDYDIKPMFKGYVFVKSELEQNEFNSLLNKLAEEKKGLIKQLENKDVSALRNEEIKMFEDLLNQDDVVKMSYAYIENAKAVVYEGPLKTYENKIVKVDKHNQLAYLDLSFMDRKIQVGLKITDKN